MKAILRLMNRKVTSERFAINSTRYVIWGVSLLVLVLGIMTLARMELGQADFFFGILLVLAVSEILVLIGLVLPICATYDMPRKT